MQPRTMLLLGAASGLLTVALGAFGAHGLKHHLGPELLAIYHTGVDYQGLHALALLACGLWALQRPSRSLSVAAWAFALGSLVFSGSLYLLALTGLRWLGAVTPLGGTAFLVGWAALVVTAWRLPGDAR
jgi:uncharacterized membrane protein YgdD (TMEM256/DUF423 family)